MAVLSVSDGELRRLERALGTLQSLDVLQIEPSHEAASCGWGGGNSIGVSRVGGQGRKPRDPDL
jgi:hypothetical protein